MGGEPAFRHDSNLRTQLLRLVKKVSAEENCPARRRLRPYDSMQRSRGKWIEPIGRLVQYQKCRIVNHRANKSEFFLHSLGVIHGKFFQGIGEFHLFQQGPRAARNLRAAEAVHLAAETDDFTSAQIVIENRLIRQISHASFDFYTVTKAVKTIDFGRS